MSSDSTSHAHPIDTTRDHQSVLQVVGWCLASITIVVVASRLATKLKVSKTFALDDGFIVISLILAVGQTGTLSVGVDNGLGQLGDISSDQADIQAKAIYAFNILFICSQYFAKCSILFFIRALTPVRSHRRSCAALIALITMWALSAVFTLIFQCHLPQLWSGQSCVNRVALFTFIGVFDIFLDICLICLPIVIVWGLQLRTKRRLIIIATFCSRIGVITAIVVQIVVLFQPQGDAASSDNPFLSWTFALLTQVVEYTSIASACVPYLKPLLDNLASGMIANDDIARHRNGGVTAASLSKRPGPLQHELRRLQAQGGTNVTRIVADNNHSTRDLLIRRSGSNPGDMGGIQQTTTYEITHERASDVVE